MVDTNYFVKSLGVNKKKVILINRKFVNMNMKISTNILVFIQDYGFICNYTTLKTNKYLLK